MSITICASDFSIHVNAFSDIMDDATSLFLYRFTVPQLRVLCVALHLPSTVTTSSRDYVPCIEALAMTCRRLAEPCQMYHVANEFGRSSGAVSRIVKTAITAPDGLVVSMYGLVGGRLHDSMVLSMCGILDTISLIPELNGHMMYGDLAYGCRPHLCCPFSNVPHGSNADNFNKSMSSVREAVEWSFHLIKCLWSFMDWSKTQKDQQLPIGQLWIVCVLLTNCHTCLQPMGNQISMYFICKPPSLEEMLTAHD
ncbi:hypothetical protein H257_04947 [Aphanomyces astaci]|uniref:DDE Tnp4 domain-containing protein n=1 Tax=Aphanomyces astaci TaxID=112090 RepID=W4GRC6_APHAT|nr:hypothetical protein H257_04947 [Aphanomyces astaci]ETV82247.1 hypothetical protein H257_04947 [Aphanomyces astaci]|eukprot:XP_009827916.1 hypothetical protein H257_04947 [Aphanomyces astaci]